ncbi:ABC transporter permease [Goodfellowiella coeruleoviolacea]|uniref:Peptide/nickel transport system permease protein n=1 Tax=Goodfellowiella coeruleoviolacea TaxID=334858 RepID=A0AAE3GBE0_9PSEU|nr:ABC transporter permease [Goodfellowiella coeruleoviolacea]MCP2165025.1 peptide/nickel transport system permease protein [Goodfellowiella coeruleoviolacea]
MTTPPLVELDPTSGLTHRETPRAAGLLRRFARHRLALVGLALLVGLVLFCYLGPLLYVTDQVHTDLGAARLAPGSAGHPLGTDDLGYDTLGRLMVAGQVSLLIGVVAGLIATALGALWGAVAGYVGGWLDLVLMRVVDAGVAIPALFLLLVAATLVTPNTWVLALVIGGVSWLVPARLMRAETVTLRERDYVRALRVVGGGRARAVFRHILPNAIGTVVVAATFQIADAILLVAYVSFLGLGLQPPATDWGGMLSKGITYTYDSSWWLILPPGIAIVLVVCAFNFVGDGLRDAFEVRGRDR